MDSFKSSGETINCEVLQTSTPGPHAAIVVVHGTSGFEPPFGAMIRKFGSALSAKGNTVLIPHYFGPIRSGADALIAFPSRRSRWVAILKDALTFATTLNGVGAGRLGLLGFSMGGHLAIWCAQDSSGPKPKAVVDFFAPINSPPPFAGIGPNVVALPPVQIHHGDVDNVVPPEQSEVFKRLLVAARRTEGTDFEMHTYPGQGHGFTGEPAVSTSTAATIAFFGRHLV